MTVQHFDVAIVGGGPAGQKAAVQGAKAGRRVVVIERQREVGGACVHHGTIPSKTLRESALHLSRVRRAADVFDFTLPDGISMPRLMGRLGDVVQAHASYMQGQLTRNGVTRLHGCASFCSAEEGSPTTLEILAVDGSKLTISADAVVIATGSRPSVPESIPVDYEHIHDSDSILSLYYVPESLTVVGGGVIACEWASIFQNLGVRVSLVNRWPRPLGFLDPELSEVFLKAFLADGGKYVGEADIQSVEWDGASAVRTTLATGPAIESEHMLVAYGRQANVQSLGLDRIGLGPNAKGLLDVDRNYQTAVPGVYAVGDVIGAPALAATAMEQGRRAVCHALGLESGDFSGLIPIGIYTIPEISSVGMDEATARATIEGVRVGRSRFDEVARGQISRIHAGMLKMVADTDGNLLGVQIAGDGAAELIHLGQMVLRQGGNVSEFVESVFNFPTLAEAYRVAALDLINQRASASRDQRLAG